MTVIGIGKGQDNSPLVMLAWFNDKGECNTVTVPSTVLKACSEPAVN